MKQILTILWLCLLPVTLCADAFEMIGSTCQMPVNLSYEDNADGQIVVRWKMPSQIKSAKILGSHELVNQSELITYDSVGYEGAAVSSLYGGMTSLGVNANYKKNYWLADDVTLAANSSIEEIEFYAYQSFYYNYNISPITGVYVLIYNGSPNDGGKVVWGNDTTNLLTQSEFTGIYRVATDYLSNDRAIMKVVANVQTILPAGKYWVAVSFSTATDSEVWGVPRAVLNLKNTGNALQQDEQGWTLWTDAGNAGTMGLPMIIRGVYDNVVGFNVFRDGKQLNDTVLSNYFYVDTTVNLATSYCYQVQAVYASCVSNLSSQLCLRTRGCPLPKSLSVAEKSDAFVFSWQATGTETGWQVVVSDSAVMDFNSKTSVFVTDTFYNLPDVQIGDLYYCYVRSDCGNNECSQWVMTNLITFPTEIGEDGRLYYLLSSESDLNKFRDLVFLGYHSINGKLANNIFFNDLWYPIGTKEHPYCGVFDGNGYFLDTMNVQIAYAGAGLFGVATGGAYFKNIGIKSGTVSTSNQYAGGILGYAVGNGEIIIENCYNKAYVTSLTELKREARSGGILGSNCSDSLSVRMLNCYNLGDIGNFSIATEQQNGGLAGWLGYNAVLKNCYNLGFIYGDSLANSPVARYATGSIERCYFLKTILGSVQRGDFIPIDDKVLLSGELAYKLDNGGNADRTNFWSQGLKYPILSDKSHFSIYKSTYLLDDDTKLLSTYNEAEERIAVETSPKGFVAQQKPFVIDDSGNSVVCEGWYFVMPFSDVSIKATYTEKSARIPLWLESFEDYAAGAKVAQQAAAVVSGRWTTWNNQPGLDEDALVSMEQVCHGTKSMKLTFGNDIVLLLDQTKGAYEIGMKIFVPSEKNAYFNLLHVFDGDNTEWAFQSYFNSDVDEYGNIVLTPGVGYIDADGAGSKKFVCASDKWMDICLKVDIDKDSAEFRLDSQLVHQWPWRVTTFGATSSKNLAAVNFFPTTSTDTSEFYVDSIALTQLRPNLPCFSPSNLKLLNQNADSAVVTWSAGGDEYGWWLMWYNVADSANNVQKKYCRQDTVVLKNLIECVTYNWCVQAVCSSSEKSEWSECATLYVPPYTSYWRPTVYVVVTPTLLEKGQSFSIDARNVSHGSLELYSSIGQLIYFRKNISLPTTICAPFVSGVYILRIRTDENFIVNEKIVIQ